jgi:Tfp pilus assembly major pilin PilA
MATAAESVTVSDKRGERVMMRVSQQCNGQAGADRQRGMTVIGMLLLIIVIAFIALIGMKVVPMYIQYYSIKSTVESIRKEPQLAQMSAQDIHNGIQKRFDIGYVENIKASDLKVRNDRSGRVIDLVYQDERELFYKLFVVLKVNESIPLSP